MMSAGQVTTGGSKSSTVTMKEQLAVFPLASVTRKVFRVAPTGKLLPVGKPAVWVTTKPGQLSCTSLLYSKRAEHKPGSVERVTSLAKDWWDGPLMRPPALQSTVGASVSLTTTVKVQEAVYEFLMEQYEQYRIQESRDTPTVQVLDRAVPAERKAKPIRWLICVCATVGAFALSLVLAALLEAGARLRREDPARHERLRQALAEMGLRRLADLW